MVLKFQLKLRSEMRRTRETGHKRDWSLERLVPGRNVHFSRCFKMYSSKNLVLHRTVNCGWTYELPTIILFMVKCAVCWREVNRQLALLLGACAAEIAYGIAQNVVGRKKSDFCRVPSSQIFSVFSHVMCGTSDRNRPSGFLLLVTLRGVFLRKYENLVTPPVGLVNAAVHVFSDGSVDQSTTT